MSHSCHAAGCRIPVKPEMLMCLSHWRMVPRPIQLKVWAAYRPGQCDDKHPSKEWCMAADAACAYVAGKERETIHHTFLGSFYPEMVDRTAKPFRGPPPPFKKSSRD